MGRFGWFARLGLCSLLGLVAHGNQAQAEDVTMVAPIVPRLHDPDTGGLYRDAYDAIFDGFSLPISLSLRTVRRAQQEFSNGDFLCIFSGIDSADFWVGTGMVRRPLVSVPFNTLALQVYVRSGSPLVRRDEDLVGLNMAAERAVAYNIGETFKNLPGSTRLIETRSVDQAFFLLQRQRVDAVVSFDLDARYYFSSGADMSVVSDPNYQFLANGEAVVCHDTGPAAEVVAFANRRIREMTDDGTLQAIFLRDLRPAAQAADR